MSKSIGMIIISVKELSPLIRYLYGVISNLLEI
jgi:hypothetical protein